MKNQIDQSTPFLAFYDLLRIRGIYSTEEKREKLRRGFRRAMALAAVLVGLLLPQGARAEWSGLPVPTDESIRTWADDSGTRSITLGASSYTWNDFRIGNDHTVTFTAGTAVNRVPNGPQSVISGTLKGNNVWILNPAGLVVNSGATIDVQGLLAAALSDNNVSSGFHLSEVGNGTIDLAGKGGSSYTAVIGKNLSNLPGNALVVNTTGMTGDGTIAVDPSGGKITFSGIATGSGSEAKATTVEFKDEASVGGGDVSASGNVTGDFAQSDGTVNASEITGTLTQSGGSATANKIAALVQTAGETTAGSVSGNATVGGTLNTASVGGTATVSGTLNGDGGLSLGGLSQSGGTVTGNGNISVSGAANQTGGSIDAGANGIALASGGSFSGTVAAGSLSAAGQTVSQDGGSIDLGTGALTAANFLQTAGATTAGSVSGNATVGGTLNTASVGGTATVSGTLNGDSGLSLGGLSQSDGTVTGNGNISIAGTANQTGGSIDAGANDIALVSGGSFAGTVAAGSLSAAGQTVSQGGGTITVAGTVTAASFAQNGGTASADTFAANVAQGDGTSIEATTAIDGNVTQTGAGSITAPTIDGTVTQTGSGTVTAGTEISGKITQSGSGTIETASATGIEQTAAATGNISVTTVSGTIVQNGGTIQARDAASGLTLSTAISTQKGTLSGNSGNITLAGGDTLSGTVVAKSLTAGTGNITQADGTVTVDETLTAGTFTQNGGTASADTFAANVTQGDGMSIEATTAINGNVTQSGAGSITAPTVSGTVTQSGSGTVTAETEVTGKITQSGSGTVATATASDIEQTDAATGRIEVTTVTGTATQTGTGATIAGLNGGNLTLENGITTQKGTLDASGATLTLGADSTLSGTVKADAVSADGKAVTQDAGNITIAGTVTAASFEQDGGTASADTFTANVTQGNGTSIEAATAIDGDVTQTGAGSITAPTVSGTVTQSGSGTVTAETEVTEKITQSGSGTVAAATASDIEQTADATGRIEATTVTGTATQTGTGATIAGLNGGNLTLENGITTQKGTLDASGATLTLGADSTLSGTVKADVVSADGKAVTQDSGAITAGQVETGALTQTAGKITADSVTAESVTQSAGATIQAGDSKDLAVTATDGDIQIAGLVSAKEGTLTLQADQGKIFDAGLVVVDDDPSVIGHGDVETSPWATGTHATHAEAKDLVLSAKEIGANGNPLDTEAGTVAATATDGSAYVWEKDGVEVKGLSATENAEIETADTGDVTVSGAVESTGEGNVLVGAKAGGVALSGGTVTTAKGSISILAGDGDIDLGQNVTANAGTVDVQAFKDGATAYVREGVTVSAVPADAENPKDLRIKSTTIQLDGNIAGSHTELDGTVIGGGQIGGGEFAFSGASLGTAQTPVKLTATTIGILATGGGVYIDNTADELVIGTAQSGVVIDRVFLDGTTDTIETGTGGPVSGVTALNGDVDIRNAGNVKLEESVLASGNVTLTARKTDTADGTIVLGMNDEEVEARIVAGAAFDSDNVFMEEPIDASGTIHLDGGIDLDGKTVRAGAGKTAKLVTAVDDLAVSSPIPAAGSYILEANKDVTVSSEVTADSGDITIRARTGDAKIEAALGAAGNGQSISVTAGKDVTATGDLSAGKNVTLTAGNAGTLSVQAVTAGAADDGTEGNATLTGGTISAAGDVKAEKGKVSATSSSADGATFGGAVTGQEVDLKATGSGKLKTEKAVTATERNAALEGASVEAVETVTADKGNATIAARNGTVTAADVKAERGSVSATGTGAVSTKAVTAGTTATLRGASVKADGEVSAGGALVAEATGADGVEFTQDAKGSSVRATANNGTVRTAGGTTLRSTAGNVVVNAATIDAQGKTAANGGSVNAAATAGATFADEVTASAAATLAAGNGTLSTEAVTANGGNATLSGNAIQANGAIVASQAVNATAGAGGATFAQDITGGTGVALASNGGDLKTEGAVAATAGNATLTGRTVEIADTGTVQATAGKAVLRATGGAVTVGGAVNARQAAVEATGDVNENAAVNATVAKSVHTTGGNIVVAGNAAGFTAPTAVYIADGTGRITLNGTVDGANALGLRAATIDKGGATIQGVQTLAIDQTAGNLVLDAASLPASVQNLGVAAGGNVEITTAGDLTVNGAYVNAGNISDLGVRQVNVAGVTAGGIATVDAGGAVNGATIAGAQGTTVEAGGAVNLTGALGQGGATVVTSPGAVTAAQITGGSVEVTAGGVVTANGGGITGANGTTVTATGIQAVGANVGQGGATVLDTNGGAINAGTLAGGSLDVNNAGAVNASVNVGGAATIQAASLTAANTTAGSLTFDNVAGLANVGTLAVNGDVNGTAGEFTTAGGTVGSIGQNGQLTVNGNFNLNGNLQAGSVNAQAANFVNGGGTLTAGALTLAGNVGAAGNNFQVSSANLQNITGGTIYLTDTAGGQVAIGTIRADGNALVLQFDTAEQVVAGAGTGLSSNGDITLTVNGQFGELGNEIAIALPGTLHLNGAPLNLLHFILNGDADASSLDVDYVGTGLHGFALYGDRQKGYQIVGITPEDQRLLNRALAFSVNTPELKSKQGIFGDPAMVHTRMNVSEARPGANMDMLALKSVDFSETWKDVSEAGGDLAEWTPSVHVDEAPLLPKLEALASEVQLQPEIQPAHGSSGDSADED